MLEFFLRHRGQVISKEQLLSRVWGLGHDPASNLVAVYIRYLREKLSNDFIHQFVAWAIRWVSSRRYYCPLLPTAVATLGRSQKGLIKKI
jgi:DNA-binding response OmpR family regulator